MSKYDKAIVGKETVNGKKIEVIVDVYDVIEAFDVCCPATQHAIKKLLAAGERGHKDTVTDLREAIASIERAIDLFDSRATSSISF